MPLRACDASPRRCPADEAVTFWFGSFGSPMRIETAGLRSTLARMAAATVFAMGAGAANAGTGEHSRWQMNMQGMVTEIGRDVAAFHDWLLWLITAISLF